MVGIIDYDAGNVKSVEKAVQFLGEETVLTRDPERILSADRVILPGVGAFGDAMDKLNRYGLVDVIHAVVEKGIPFFGNLSRAAAAVRIQRGEPGGRRAGNPERRDRPHPGWNRAGRAAAENPPRRMEFPGVSESGTAVCGNFAAVLRLFRAFLLPEGRGGYRDGARGIRGIHRRVRGKGKRIRLSVPSGEEFPDGPRHPEKFSPDR